MLKIKLSKNIEQLQPLKIKKKKERKKKFKSTTSKNTKILLSFNFKVFKKTLSVIARDFTLFVEILKKKKKPQKTNKSQTKGDKKTKFSKKKVNIIKLKKRK